MIVDWVYGSSVRTTSLSLRTKQKFRSTFSRLSSSALGDSMDYILIDSFNDIVIVLLRTWVIGPYLLVPHKFGNVEMLSLFLFAVIAFHDVFYDIILRSFSQIP